MNERKYAIFIIQSNNIPQIPSSIEVISKRYTSKFVNILNQKIDQMCHSNTSLRK